jgi:hypothetical protein
LTGTAPTPAPAPPPAEYRCRRCNHLLGGQRPGCLHLGGAHVLGKVLLACAACGRRWVWSGPAAAPADGASPRTVVQRESVP